MTDRQSIIVTASVRGSSLGCWQLESQPGRAYSFGRAPGNDMVITAATVSKQHGCFVYENGQWYLCDIGSSNGSFVDGGRAVKTPVYPGCSISLGQGYDAVGISVELCGQNFAASAGYGGDGEYTVRYTPGSGDSFGGQKAGGGALQLLIFDGDAPARRVELSAAGSFEMSFGRDPSNHIVINSPVASARHGRIGVQDGRCYIIDDGSHNGLLVNGWHIRSQKAELSAGDTVRIDTSDASRRGSAGVLMAVASSGGDWKEMDLYGMGSVTIGRDKSNTICLSHVGVSRFHAQISADSGGYTIYDTSTNGTFVDGQPVRGAMRLTPRSVISITTSTMYVSGGKLFYSVAEKGLSLEARHITRDVTDGGKQKRILNDVNLSIEPGEFVAIVGGSGCGKSTLLNALTGYDRATAGQVMVGDLSLYPNYDYFKSILGYVPQQDIVYDFLELKKMLMYTAQLRMPKDTSPQEMERRVDEVLRIVELSEYSDSMIKKLSGGQRKRASIAVELLADPGLFFLDEPTSGLDPGTERNLMYTLRELSNTQHKTVVMVTHTTLNLHLCDKIVFMGKGGKLCYCGSPAGALSFFGVDNFVEIYNLVANDTDHWHGAFAAIQQPAPRHEGGADTNRKLEKSSFFRQVGVVSKRYLNLICNDRARLMLLLLEPVLLGIVLKVCASDAVYDSYLETKNMLFTFVCCAIWVGIFNSIQEICKERVILKREYMANLRLEAYISSKFAVQALLCLVQTVLLFGMFAITIGLPEEGFLMENPVPEMLVTTYLAVLSASCMGLIVSALSKNADRAMTVSPFLLVIQMVFAGIIFKLEGAVKFISNLTVSRWAISALGISTDLEKMYEPVEEQNELIAALTGEEVAIDKSLELFERTEANMLECWLVMLGFCIVCCVISALVLRRVSKDSR